MKFYQNKYPMPDEAKYVVDYIYDNNSGSNYYFQLTRLSDGAILYANKDLNNIIIECWKMDIPHKEVAFI